MYQPLALTLFLPSLYLESFNENIPNLYKMEDKKPVLVYNHHYSGLAHHWIHNV